MLLATASADGLAAGEPAASASPVVNRTNFLVADLDRSLALYRDILGFKVNVTMPIRPDSYMYDIFGVDRTAKLRLAFLAGADGKFGTIGLTEVKGVERGAPGPAFPSVLIVAIENGIESLHEKTRAAKLDTTQIYELTNPARREFILTDLDGNRILLMQLREAAPAR
jgi:catechol 2,3-dioxygenase-like lactoylglutathione lyase family enzyme